MVADAFEWFGVGHGDESLGEAKFSNGVLFKGVAPAICETVVAGRSTSLSMRLEDDSAMVESWFLPRLAAGCVSFGVERCRGR